MTLNFEDSLKMTGQFELFMFEGEEPMISGSKILYNKNKTKLVDHYCDHNLIVNSGRAAVCNSMTPLGNGGGFTIEGERIQHNPITYFICGSGAYGVDQETGEPIIDTNNDPLPPSSADRELVLPVYKTEFASVTKISALSVKFTARIPKQYPEESYPDMTNIDGTQKDIEAWLNEYGLLLSDGTTLFAKVNKKSTPKSGDLSLVAQWVINF